MTHTDGRCYRAVMQPEQVVIVQWMRRVMAKRGWNANSWAREAGISATTITRSMKPENKSTTSIEVLERLAKAAGEPSILSVLSGDHEQASLAAVPSVEALASLLGAVLPLAPQGRTTARSLQILSAALAHGIELLGDHRATTDNDAALAVAARGAVSRFRDLTRQ